MSDNSNINNNPHGKARGGKYAQRRKRAVSLLIFICVLSGMIILPAFFVSACTPGPRTRATPEPADNISASTPSETEDKASETPFFVTAQNEPPGPTADPDDWRAKFPDKFTDGAVEKTKNSYKSANINITITKVQENRVTYFAADIYIAELKYFKTAFPGNSDSMGGRAFTDKIARETDAILAVNGDHCVDNPGTIVRNGRIYRLEKAGDVLVMNRDGSMRTYGAGELDLSLIENEGAYQVWTFGPMLLRDGEPMTEFELPDDIAGLHPRTAVGYYEPGHYCFVTVDGRQDYYSIGMNIQELSQLFCELGCTAAFNLDGGRSTEMAFMGKTVNKPCDGNRSTTDILYIGEE